MKKILFSLIFMVVIGFTAKVQAQCEIRNVVVSINSAGLVPTGDSLAVNFNVSFDIDANGGNKYIYIHSWKSASWPNYWECTNGVATLNPKKGPVAADLISAFLKLSINNNVTAPAQPTYTTYGIDPSVVMSTAAGISKVYNAVTVSGTTYDRFTLTGVQIKIPGVINVADPLFVTTDVFSTQAAGSGANTPVHCVNCGILQSFNDPIISGFKNCVSPRTISFGIYTQGAVPASFTYKIYKDNGDKTFNPGIGLDVDVTLPGPADVITLNTSGVGGQDGRDHVGYVGNNVTGEHADYWLVVTKVGGVSGVSKLFLHPQGCVGLPVDFKSFTATRNKANVVLKWTTSTEKNNNGFAVERNIDNANWEEVGFVRSNAIGGNSNLDLDYQFIDNNNTKGISQYRIKQVDIDSRFKYTEVRSVKGDGQIGEIIVYPNPSTDGRINVVFDNTSVIRNIMVTDMSGRTVKQINGVSNNNITIDNLMPGMYSLRVLVPETGEQTVKKIVVNKR